MALIVEDGTGKPDAETYVDLTYVAAYLQKLYPDFFTNDWSPLTDAQKETAARLGTRYIEDYYRGKWKGHRTFERQALAFPRSGVQDVDGYALSAVNIPDRLKQASCEAIMRAVDGSLQPDIPAAARNVIHERKKLDVLESDVTYAGVKPNSPSYPVIDRLLADFVNSGLGQVPVERG